MDMKEIVDEETCKKVDVEREAERDAVLALLTDMEFIAEDLTTEWDKGEGTWVFTFRTLHIWAEDGSIRGRTWTLTSAQAELYLMGFRDGANYLMFLQQTANQTEG